MLIGCCLLQISNVTARTSYSMGTCYASREFPGFQMVMRVLNTLRPGLFQPYGTDCST